MISGFHSSLEQSVLRLLMEGGGMAVIVLARPVATATLKSAWRGALDAGRLVVISQSAAPRRLTEQEADERNDLAARLADSIAIAHASPDGHLSRQCVRWRARGLVIRSLG